MRFCKLDLSPSFAHFFHLIFAEMKAIRLSGGLDRCSGKVEIHRNGSWGTVCDNCWYEHIATLVCSMLGCGTAPKKFSQFNPPLVHNHGAKWYYICQPGSRDLWQCVEWEESTKPHLCVSSKASGVVCDGGWVYGWDTSPAVGPLMENVFVPRWWWQELENLELEDLFIILC